MEPPKVASVKWMCSKCNVYLCKEHFAAYHFGGTRMTRWMSPKLFAVQLCRNVPTVLTYIICRITIMGSGISIS